MISKKRKISNNENAKSGKTSDVWVHLKKKEDQEIYMCKHCDKCSLDLSKNKNTSGIFF